MTKREVYKLGQRLGANAAKWCDEPGPAERREACGCECEDTPWPDGGRECEACLTVTAYESEQGARDYSPWECYASEINNGRNPEGQWEAYDAGVDAGSKAGVLARLARAATTDSAAGGGR